MGCERELMANTSTKPRVLLVADDVDLSSSFTTALNSAGYEVNIVNSFQNALGRIGGYRPHIVVIDSGTSAHGQIVPVYP